VNGTPAANMRMPSPTMAPGMQPPPAPASAAPRQDEDPMKQAERRLVANGHKKDGWIAIANLKALFKLSDQAELALKLLEPTTLWNVLGKSGEMQRKIAATVDKDRAVRDLVAQVDPTVADLVRRIEWKAEQQRKADKDKAVVEGRIAARMHRASGEEQQHQADSTSGNSSMPAGMIKGLPKTNLGNFDRGPPEVVNSGAGGAAVTSCTGPGSSSPDASKAVPLPPWVRPQQQPQQAADFQAPQKQNHGRRGTWSGDAGEHTMEAPLKAAPPPRPPAGIPPVPHQPRPSPVPRAPMPVEVVSSQPPLPREQGPSRIGPGILDAGHDGGQPKPELFEVLSQVNLNAFFEPLNRLGVERPADLRYVNDDDLKTMGMTVIQQRKFKELVQASCTSTSKGQCTSIQLPVPPPKLPASAGKGCADSKGDGKGAGKRDGKKDGKRDGKGEGKNYNKGDSRFEGFMDRKGEGKGKADGSIPSHGKHHRKRSYGNAFPSDADRSSSACNSGNGDAHINSRGEGKDAGKGDLRPAMPPPAPPPQWTRKNDRQEVANSQKEAPWHGGTPSARKPDENRGRSVFKMRRFLKR